VFTYVAQQIDPDVPLAVGLVIAAVAVVLFHSSFLAFNYAGGEPPWIWRRGYLAVDLFFFLSGFVLAHVYGNRFAEERSWQTVGKFLWARFCRIYPASLFTAGIFVLLYATGRTPFPPGISFTDQLIAASIQWAERIMEKIDRVSGKV